MLIFCNSESNFGQKPAAGTAWEAKNVQDDLFHIVSLLRVGLNNPVLVVSRGHA